MFHPHDLHEQLQHVVFAAGSVAQTGFVPGVRDGSSKRGVVQCNWLACCPRFRGAGHQPRSRSSPTLWRCKPWRPRQINLLFSVDCCEQVFQSSQRHCWAFRHFEFSRSALKPQILPHDRQLWRPPLHSSGECRDFDDDHSSSPSQTKSSIARSAAVPLRR